MTDERTRPGRRYPLGRLDLERSLIILDTETTGADAQSDRVVQVALIKLRPDGTSVEYESLVNPGVHIPREATEIHGITDAMVAPAPSFAEIADEIILFCQEDGLFPQLCDLAGFNLIRFDLPLLGEEFRRAAEVPAFQGSKLRWTLEGRRILDAQILFHRMEPRDLSAALRFYCGRDHAGAHAASDDTRATLEVLLAQVERYSEQNSDFPHDPDGLHAFCNQPDAQFFDASRRFRRRDGEPVFTFGQYRGRRLREVAAEKPEYLDWMLAKGDFSEEVRKLVRAALDDVLRQARGLPEGGAKG